MIGQVRRGLIGGLAVLAALWVAGLLGILVERRANVELMAWAALPFVLFAGLLVLHRLSSRAAALEGARNGPTDDAKTAAESTPKSA